jgi:hypothetical protein
MGQHYVKHATWDTGKTMCGRYVPIEAVDNDEFDCKTCCKAFDHHFGDNDD